MIRKYLTSNLAPSNRIFGLDVLRAFAILFVVIGHGRHLLPKNLNFLHDVFVFDGVSLFFVLSGYLIGGIIIKLINKEKLNTLKQLFSFWMRRWYRTIPNYLLILLILIAVNYSRLKNIADLDMYKYFIFSQNLFSVHPSFFPEAWSLSVEEWFYILTPLLLLFLLKINGFSSRKLILAIAIGFILGGILLRVFVFNNMDVNGVLEYDLYFRKNVFTRLDCIMFGLIGAYLKFYYNDSWNRLKKQKLLIGLIGLLLLKVLVMVEIVSVSGFFYCVFSFSLFGFFTVLLLPFLDNYKKSKGFIFSAITFLSIISYSMYLINYSLIQGWLLTKINFELLNLPSQMIVLIKYLTYWVLTILISTIIFLFYESQLTKLRDNKKFNPFI